MFVLAISPPPSPSLSLFHRCTHSHPLSSPSHAPSLFISSSPSSHPYLSLYVSIHPSICLPSPPRPRPPPLIVFRPPHRLTMLELVSIVTHTSTLCDDGSINDEQTVMDGGDGTTNERRTATRRRHTIIHHSSASHHHHHHAILPLFLPTSCLLSCPPSLACPSFLHLYCIFYCLSLLIHHLCCIMTIAWQIKGDNLKQFTNKSFHQ